MSEKRSSFSGSVGFILAAAGSAVGLGNIWRFPYLVARYGGGIFLLVYIIIAVTFGTTLMLAEIAIGRKTRMSAINAYGSLDKRFRFLGTLGSLVPIIIFPYYSVIGGWVMKYLIAFIKGDMTKAASDGYFDSFISRTFEPITWLFLFMAITALIVFLGVEKGVERTSKLLMPVLVVLSIVIAGYVIAQPNSKDGVLFYLKPDFSKFSSKTVLAAMGQLFYSMSLAMGIMITYGSYMKRDINLEKSVTQIEIFDTCIAFISGLMIVPAVFIFSGGDEEVLNKGAGLMFVTLPKVFESMRFGRVIGVIFFILVLCAALTSAISLMETVLSIVKDKTGWSRNKTCLVVFVCSLVLALPSALGFSIWSGVKIIGLQILDLFDFISNSIIMPIVALLTCIFVGYVIKPKVIIDEIRISSKFRKEKMFTIMIKYIAPVLLIAILISSILEAIGVISFYIKISLKSLECIFWRFFMLYYIK